MRITFLGAAQSVTGSCYLVETETSTFLVDCGMFQGRARDDHSNSDALPIPLKDVAFLLLTHAHIDHSGRIPKLWKDGFRGPVYATKATTDLCGLMLPDSGHIQEMEHEWRNRKALRAGKKPEEPLYTALDATQSLQLFRREHYDKPFHPAPGITVTFRDAGHVLGSSITELLISDGGETKKVVFSGDLGNTEIPLMRDPTHIEGADLLILESTYGNRLHQDKAERTDKVDLFVSIVNETIRNGGNVVIPSFAVGRTQEIIYEINRQIALENGKGIPSDRMAGGASDGDPKGGHTGLSGKSEQRRLFLTTPVFVDSPLAISATEVFRDNEDCFDAEAQEYIRNRDNPLDFPNLHLTVSSEESKAINADSTPKIIIASSGMCDAGRIRHHLKHNLWRPESTIVFVGYQAPGTLGRQLVDGDREVRLFGEDITVEARVAFIEGYSGHADRDGLLAWVEAMDQKPSRILLVHGEPEAMEDFSASLQQRFQIPAHSPAFGESVVFGAAVPDRVPAPATTEAPPERLPMAAGQIRAGAILPQLEALRNDFMGMLQTFHDSMRKADNRRDRERTVAKARQWEQDMRRVMERYRRR